MSHTKIRAKFLKFFEDRGHKIVPSSSLLPDDPSVLFTTAGMQQFKPYFLEVADSVKDFGSKNVVSLQKCFRAVDIDEVGDTSHGTFFEMLGNFSFGQYFKKEAIPLSYEFITSQEGLGIDPRQLYVTAFKGDDQVPRDEEAIQLWQKQFKKAEIKAEIGERIFLYGREKNWWEIGVGGPAGPDAEMFYDTGLPHNPKFGEVCHPNCDCGRFVEIGNDVFMQYKKVSEGQYEPLEKPAVDNGRGFERMVMAMEGKTNIYETSIFQPLLDILSVNVDNRTKRVVADHIRASVFLIADGVTPSNKDQGYVLRRLLRRVLTVEYKNDLSAQILEDVILRVIKDYGEDYQSLLEKKDHIINIYFREREKFLQTLQRGLKELEQTETIDVQVAFRLYESYGLPYEVIKDIAGSKADSLNREQFDEEFKKHQAKSRVGAEKKFGGHGLILDTGELKAANEDELKVVTRLHTATHMLHASLRKVLGGEVHQAGSDITVERLRFDFTFPRKVNAEEIKNVEELVNQAIKDDLEVIKQEMPYEDAVKTGALSFFKLKYPPKVNVYSVGDFSKELCGGPHVTHTSEIGHFKITKEEASSAGVRRIRAIVANR